MDFDSQLNRRRLLQAGAGLSLAGLLAACGGDDDEGSTSAAAPESSAAAAPESSAAAPESSAAAPESSAGGESSAAAPESSAAEGDVVTQGTVKLASSPTDEKGSLEVFDWQGYEDTYGCPDACVPFWNLYNENWKATNPLKFTFLEDDQQALAKCAAGFKTDVIHPCIAYVRSWQEAGLIQPWDTSYITGFDTIQPELYQAGVIDGEIYAIPWDWGFSALAYRTDNVQPEEQSWNVLLDERYKGRIGFFSDGVAIIKVGGLINGVADPNKMTQDEIEAAKETMIRAKPQIRMFWGSESEAIKEAVAGNLDIVYAWPGTWLQIRDGMPDTEWMYMQPKEGRLAWVCSYVLHKDSTRPALAHEMMKCIPTAENAVALIDLFGYGAAGASTPEILDQVQNQEAVDAFGLRDLETALAPPAAWTEQYLPNRADYVRAAEEVKAA
jgi:putative spermidine/putrescine transport system substrate-binding protein/spermidine/putrescine transport system substrate-binding protein